jgi:hypothetical protein
MYPQPTSSSMLGMCHRMGPVADQFQWYVDGLTKGVLKRIVDTEQRESQGAWNAHAATTAPSER